jgi:uncharacterized protein YrzB (UPF0473 family)
VEDCWEERLLLLLWL